uniref:Cell shape-determining protein MreC n=1 Tax=Schlesneria paludicola TaxID=360056 RepID=A0A7C2NWF1_9PLAN
MADLLHIAMSPLRRIAGSAGAVGLWSALLGGALWFAPPALAGRVHSLAWDALRPGLQCVKWGERHVRTAWTNGREAEYRSLHLQIKRLEADLAAAQHRSERLTAQMLLLRDAPPGGIGEGSPERLFQPAVIDAAVLGQSLSQAWRQGTVIDRGWSHGLRESALVLRSSHPLIDRGQRDQIAAEDMLLLGRTVLGKVETVGRWTSTFVPVTDPAFRGRAQLVRQTDQGPQWGATGLLRGEGRVCRLDGIAGNEAVRVGDLVFTAERDAALGTALSYGTVVEAQLGLDDREWTIVVQPPANPGGVGEVQVLRAALNPARFWTQ